MKTGYETAGMSAQEEEFYALCQAILSRLERICDLLERQGSVRPG